jgi:hypothetical protein
MVGRMSSVRTWRSETRPECSNGRLMKSGVSAMSSTFPASATCRFVSVEEALAVVGRDDDQRAVVEVLLV